MAYSMTLKMGKPRRDRIAHFCEHHGLHIEFTPAKTTWHAIVPSAVRPWWLELETLKTDTSERSTREDMEVTENA